MSISPRQRGLTMIELIVFIVIVSIAVVAILQVISLNTARSADPIRRKQALAIAEGMMDEIRAAGFTWCDITDPNVETATSAAECTKLAEAMGPEAGGGARPFDNVNDYGRPNGAAAVYTTDTAGTPFPTGYSAAVTITNPATFGPAGAPLAAAAVLRIVVTVTFDAGNSVVLEGYRTHFTPN